MIANLVVPRGDGRVLVVRHDPDDERAREVLEELGGLTCRSLSMVFVESFRGRRGWHLVFHYRADVEGDPSGDLVESGWFEPDDLPRTMHGAWERTAVRRVLAESAT